jgi:hypothetical protein
VAHRHCEPETVGDGAEFQVRQRQVRLIRLAEPAAEVRVTHARLELEVGRDSATGPSR